MFDRAYSNLFAAELSRNAHPPSAKDPPEAWAVRRLWQAKASRAPAANETGTPSQPLSRYLTDFQVAAQVAGPAKIHLHGVYLALIASGGGGDYCLKEASKAGSGCSLSCSESDKLQGGVYGGECSALQRE